MRGSEVNDVGIRRETSAPGSGKLWVTNYWKHETTGKKPQEAKNHKEAKPRSSRRLL